MKHTRILLSSALFITSLQLSNAATITLAGDPIGGGQLISTTFTIGAFGTTGGVNNFPNGEPPADAIDSNGGTKYLNFAKLNTGYIVTPVLGLSNVTGITFTTANDASERDPMTFSLYGSTTQTASTTPGATFDLTNFTAITLNQVTNLTAGPGNVNSVTFSNVGNFNTYLLVFPTVRDSATANSMQIGDALLTGTAIPEPSSLVLLGLGAISLLARHRRNI